MYIRRHLLGLLPRLIHLLSNPSTFHLIIPNLIGEYFRVFGFSLILPSYVQRANVSLDCIAPHAPECGAWESTEVLGNPQTTPPQCESLI